MIIDGIKFLGKLAEFIGDWLNKINLFENQDLLNAIISTSIIFLLAFVVPVLIVYFIFVVLPRALLAYYDVKWEKKLLLKNLANTLLCFYSELVQGINLELNQIAFIYQPSLKGEESDQMIIDASPVNLIGRLRKTNAVNKKNRDILIETIWNARNINFGETLSRLEQLAEHTKKLFNECDGYIIEHQKALELLKAPNEILDGLTQINIGLIKKQQVIISINRELRRLKPRARLARWREVAKEIKNTIQETE